MLTKHRNVDFIIFDRSPAMSGACGNHPPVKVFAQLIVGRQYLRSVLDAGKTAPTQMEDGLRAISNNFQLRHFTGGP